MTKKRLLPGLFLLPVVLLLAAYLAWPLWITPVAKRLLADANVELVAANIGRPGWQQLVVRDLTLRYAMEAYSAEVMVPQLSVTYVWQQLLERQLNRLQIPAAQIQLTKQKNDLSPTADEPLQIAALLPSVWLPQLPVAALHIDQLNLSLPQALDFGDLSGNLHVSDGQLQLQLVGSAVQQEKPLALELQILVDQNNRIQLDLQHNAQPVITASSQITGAAMAGKLGGKLDEELDEEPDEKLDQKLSGQLTVDLTAATTLLKQLELLARDDQLRGQAALQWQLPIPIPIPIPEAVVSDDWAVTADFQSQLAVDGFKLGEVSAAAVKYSSAGQAQLSASITRLQFAAGSTLQMRQLKTTDITIKKLDASLPSAFNVFLQTEQSQQQLTIPELALALPVTEVYWQEKPYRFKSARIKLQEVGLDLRNPEQLKSAISLTLTGLDLYSSSDNGDLDIKPLNLQGHWQLENDQLKGNLELSDTAAVMLIRGSMTHNLASGTGRLSAQLDTLRFKKTQSYFPRLFSNWRYPLDFFAGQLAMDSRVTWRKAQLDVQATLALTNIGGFYGTNLFRGLNTVIVIHGPLENFVVVAEKLTLNSVDVGMPIKNIKLALSATAKAAQIKDFQAELLGGLVGQKFIRYDFTQKNNQLLLQLRGLQLAQLVGLGAGVKGSGILDGELPIRISATGVSVQQGEIKARSPGGLIKYQGAKTMAAAATDVGVGFALQALENFHYEMLDAKASYSEDGQLILATTLQGRNPDMSEQRPVRYNITIQENIPALIESLKLTQHIGDDIERRIQTFYKKDK